MSAVQSQCQRWLSIIMIDRWTGVIRQTRQSPAPVDRPRNSCPSYSSTTWSAAQWTASRARLRATLPPDQCPTLHHDRPSPSRISSSYHRFQHQPTSRLQKQRRQGMTSVVVCKILCQRVMRMLHTGIRLIDFIYIRMNRSDTGISELVIRYQHFFRQKPSDGWRKDDAWYGSVLCVPFIPLKQMARWLEGHPVWKISRSTDPIASVPEQLAEVSK